MGEDFDIIFDNSRLPSILSLAKTLSKEECRRIFRYFKENRPLKVMELGVQFGCSTAVFLEISKWLGIDINLHSWDIKDSLKKKCASRDQFKLHIENIEGRELQVIEEYKPDLIFLDAHPYHMTRALMEICLHKKINFMSHDVALTVYDTVKRNSNNFENLKAYGAWELYIMRQIFGDEVLSSDHYEDNRVKIDFVRDKYGLAVVEMK